MQSLSCAPIVSTDALKAHQSYGFGSMTTGRKFKYLQKTSLSSKIYTNGSEKTAVTMTFRLSGYESEQNGK
jgi:hypothetical protein